MVDIEDGVAFFAEFLEVFESVPLRAMIIAVGEVEGGVDGFEGGKIPVGVIHALFAGFERLRAAIKGKGCLRMVFGKGNTAAAPAFGEAEGAEVVVGVDEGALVVGAFKADHEALIDAANPERVLVFGNIPCPIQAGGCIAALKPEPHCKAGGFRREREGERSTVIRGVFFLCGNGHTQI